MPEKPAALVRRLRRAQVPSRAGHRDVVDSLEREPQKLMDVSGDHVLHTITACNTGAGENPYSAGPRSPARTAGCERIIFTGCDSCAFRSSSRNVSSSGASSADRLLSRIVMCVGPRSKL